MNAKMKKYGLYGALFSAAVVGGFLLTQSPSATANDTEQARTEDIRKYNKDVVSKVILADNISNKMNEFKERSGKGEKLTLEELDNLAYYIIAYVDSPKTIAGQASLDARGATLQMEIWYLNNGHEPSIKYENDAIRVVKKLEKPDNYKKVVSKIEKAAISEVEEAEKSGNTDIKEVEAIQ